MRNPKIDKQSRIVCAYHNALGQYSFHKITNKNKVAMSPHLPTVIAKSFSEAVDKANERSPVKIHKTRFRESVTDIRSCFTWNEYVELAWENSNNNVKIEK